MTALRYDLAALAVDAAAPGHRVAAPLFDGFCSLFFRRLGSLAVEREAALPARPYMICANHRSHVDSLVLMQAAGLRFAQCGLLAAEDYYFRRAARLRLVSSVLRLVPVERRPTADGFAATLAACRRFLDTGGRMLVAYPEGTRSADLAMARFKRGPVTLALRFGLPVVPAFVSGTERVMAKGAGLPRPAAVRVRFGAPLEVAAVSGVATRDQARDLTRRLEERVRALAVA